MVDGSPGQHACRDDLSYVGRRDGRSGQGQRAAQRRRRAMITVALKPAPDEPARAEEIVTGEQSAIPGMRSCRISTPRSMAEHGLPLNRGQACWWLIRGDWARGPGLRPGDILRGINDESAGDTATADRTAEAQGQVVVTGRSARRQNAAFCASGSERMADLFDTASAGLCPTMRRVRLRIG